MDERELDAAIADLLHEAQYAKAEDILILKIVSAFVREPAFIERGDKLAKNLGITE